MFKLLENSKNIQKTKIIIGHPQELYRHKIILQIRWKSIFT